MKKIIPIPREIADPSRAREDECAGLRARVAELEAGLRPFAEMADEVDKWRVSTDGDEGDLLDDGEPLGDACDMLDDECRLTVKDLRTSPPPSPPPYTLGVK